jgi:hypothetical protein
MDSSHRHEAPHHDSPRRDSLTVMSHDMMTLNSPFVFPAPLSTDPLFFFWSSHPPMVTP